MSFGLLETFVLQWTTQLYQLLLVIRSEKKLLVMFFSDNFVRLKPLQCTALASTKYSVWSLKWSRLLYGFLRFGLSDTGSIFRPPSQSEALFEFNMNHGLLTHATQCFQTLLADWQLTFMKRNRILSLWTPEWVYHQRQIIVSGDAISTAAYKKFTTSTQFTSEATSFVVSAEKLRDALKLVGPLKFVTLANKSNRGR